ILRSRAPLSANQLVYYVALLAGLGPLAQAAAAEQSEMLQAGESGGRTCIDGGGRLIFSVRTPGQRSLRVITRCGPVQESVIPWRRTYYLMNGVVERWETETYADETQLAWQRAVSIAQRAGTIEELRRVHAIIGPHSHIYCVTWSLQPTCSAWVSWQLDRTLAVDRALELLDYGDFWPEAAALWSSLLGFSANTRRGPWSIGLMLGGEPRIRVGSTNWVRRVEEREKRQRLANIVEQQGGDRRFAEALYKLVESAVRPYRPRSIGRAMELQFGRVAMEAAEFYICMP